MKTISYLTVPMEPFYCWRRFASDVHIILCHFSCFYHNRFQVCTIDSWFYWKEKVSSLLIRNGSLLFYFLTSHKFINIYYNYTKFTCHYIKTSTYRPYVSQGVSWLAQRQERAQLCSQLLHGTGTQPFPSDQALLFPAGPLELQLPSPSLA